MRQDEDTSEQVAAGSLRFWIDVLPLEHKYREANIQAPPSKSFKVFITVWDVTGISIFKDFGERNDVYVKASLHTKDATGNLNCQSWSTDVHKWAGRKATFNWRHCLDVRCPAERASLFLSLMDEDK